MPSEESSEPLSLRDRAVQFLLGAAAGFVLSLLALYFVWMSASQVRSIHSVVISIFVLACGTASAIWGKPFLNRLLALLDSIPYI